ncbi:MAG: hypothetical protein OCD00_20145 [Colwellia sp.]
MIINFKVKPFVVINTFSEKIWTEHALLFFIIIILTAGTSTNAEASPINNPLVEQRADPWVYKHSDGYYYFTGSVPELFINRRYKTLEF